MNERTPMTPPDTSQRVQGALSGSREDLEWLIERFTPLLLAQADYRLPRELRRVHEPEDVVSTTWSVVIPKLGDIRPRDGRWTPVLVRFMSRVVLRQVNKLMRDEGRRLARADHNKDAADLAAPDPAGIVTRIARREIGDAVLEQLGALTAEHREVIILRAIEQLTNAAAATELGISPGAAATRFHRACERLRETTRGTVMDALM